MVFFAPVAAALLRVGERAMRVSDRGPRSLRMALHISKMALHVRGKRARLCVRLAHLNKPSMHTCTRVMFFEPTMLKTDNHLAATTMALRR